MLRKNRFQMGIYYSATLGHLESGVGQGISNPSAKLATTKKKRIVKQKVCSSVLLCLLYEGLVSVQTKMINDMVGYKSSDLDLIPSIAIIPPITSIRNFL